MNPGFFWYYGYLKGRGTELAMFLVAPAPRVAPALTNKVGSGGSGSKPL